MSTGLMRWCCAGLAVAVLASAREASAYCRSNSCKNESLCLQDDQPVGTCKALFWPSDCLGYAIHQEASTEIDYQQISDVVDAAFKTWLEAPCDGGTPGIRVRNLGPVACGAREMNLRNDQTRQEDGMVPGNANVVAFRDEGWLDDPDHAPHMLALTWIQFDQRTGRIWGADMEINTHLYDFVDAADPNAGPGYDLLSVVTHEVGHFLGLDHTLADPAATMYPNYDSTDRTNFRTLHPDDIAGICQIFPPRDFTGVVCNPIPPHGFSPECAEDQVITCGVAPPSGGTGWGAALAAAALAAAGLRRAGQRHAGRSGLRGARRNDRRRAVVRQ